MSRRVALNLVAFTGVFVLMLWWAVNNIITFDFIERPYEISGEFAATAGVATNSEVAYLGVNHGAVRSVVAVDGKVLITMSIDREKRIPAGSRARIFRKSAIGEPYIDFEPPPDHEDGGPYLEPGDVVPLERTTVPLEFSELLRSASRVLGSVEPEATRTLIHELAVALHGRGDTLRNLTVDSDALLATFAERSELLDSLSSNGTRLTRTVTERRGALSSAVSDLAAVGQSLRAVEPETRVLLDRGTELLRTTADLVGDVKQDLDCVLSDLDEIIDVTTTDENLGHLANTLDDGPTGFEYVWLTRDEEPGGVWVRVSILFDSANPADQYVPRKDLPAVPEIPPCLSPLAPAPSGGALASEGRVEGQAAPAPVLFGSGPTPADRSGAAAVVVVLSAVLLGLLARRQARP